jgi:sulfur transfer complex TusBCD TusB component (DsrH family)
MSAISLISRVWAMFPGSRASARITCSRHYVVSRAISRRGYDAQMSEVVYPMKDEDFVDLAYFLARTK